MFNNVLFIIFAWAVCLAALSAQAADSPPPADDAKPADETIPDEVLKRSLTPTQLLQWTTAEKKIRDGKSLVESGEHSRERASAPGAGDPKLQQQALKSADKAVNDGNAAISEGEGIIAQLRNTVQQNVLKNKALADAAKSDTLAQLKDFQLDTAQIKWADLAPKLGQDMWKSLTDTGYNHLYLSEMFVFDEKEYERRPDLTNVLRVNLLKVRRSTTAFVSQHTWNFNLVRDGASLVIDYPDRKDLAVTQTKAAVIFGEILVEPDRGCVFLSLRAVDLANWHVCYDHLYLITLDATLGKLLGLDPATLPKASPAAAASEKLPVDPMVSIKLEDPKLLLPKFRVAGTPYVFRFEPAETATDQPNRLTLLLLKSVINGQARIAVTDADFLTQVFHTEVKDAASLPQGDANAAWTVPANSDPKAPIQFSLKAHKLGTKTDIEVGNVTISRTP